jgi:hypothetical protein
MTLTPEQFNKLATKDYLDERLADMSTEKDHNEVMDTLDAVVKKLDNIEHAFVSNLAAHDRFEERISRPEQHLNLSPYEFSLKK